VSDDRRLYHPESIHTFAWVTCRCGKERQVAVRDFPELADKRLNLAKHTLCKTCSQKFSREINECPESVVIEGGVSACRLPYEHEGRCQPHEFIRKHLLALIAQEGS